jgi:hypothetical protein
VSKKVLRKINLPTNRVFRIGPLALAHDPGQALVHGGLMFVTHLTADHRNAAGELLGHYDLGSGVVTIKPVNDLVSDAVTGTSVVPTLARYRYMDSGTSSTAVTDGDTALNAPCQTSGGISRPTATLSNSQSATTSNHTAILKYSATVTYPGTYSVTEWGLFDDSRGLFDSSRSESVPG